MLELNAIGHLGQDAKVNFVNGKSVINFSIAYTEKYRNGQGVEVKNTTWIDCSYWVEKTTVAQYMKKGGLLFIRGKPEARTFTGRDNKTNAVLSVRIAFLQLLQSAREDTGSGPRAPAQQQGPGSGPIPEASDLTEPIDDLPF